MGVEAGWPLILRAVLAPDAETRQAFLGAALELAKADAAANRVYGPPIQTEEAATSEER